VHVDDEVLVAVRARFGDPVELRWEGEISAAEWALATHNPSRKHDVTLLILDPGRRLALIHHTSCGDCGRCRAGHESTCERFAEPTAAVSGERYFV